MSKIMKIIKCILSAFKTEPKPTYQELLDHDIESLYRRIDMIEPTLERRKMLDSLKILDAYNIKNKANIKNNRVK